MSTSIPPKHLAAFRELASALSPENLSCDGERPASEARRVEAKLRKEWRQLERQVGRTVTENEIWQTVYEEYS